METKLCIILFPQSIFNTTAAKMGKWFPPKYVNLFKCIHNIKWPITTRLSGFRWDSASPFQHQFDWLKCPVTLPSLPFPSSLSSLFRNYPLFLHRIPTFLCIFRTRIWIWKTCCCNLCTRVYQFLEEVFIKTLSSI